MSGVEVCVIIIPNDFSNGNQDTVSKAQRVNNPSEEKKWDGADETSVLDQHWHETSDACNRTTMDRKSNASSVSFGQHTRDYPCPECNQSLASRFRYHTMRKLLLRDTIWIPINKNKEFLILCYTELGAQCDSILNELRRAEIGIRDGTKVFFLPISCALGIRKIVEKQETFHVSKANISDDDEEHNSLFNASPSMTNYSSHHLFRKSIRARMNVHKLIGLIRQQTLLTFDYLFFCVLASIIACLGLLEDNTVIIVASMLISPLMGPIMGFLIGVRIRDKTLWFSGLKCECIGLAVSVITGFLLGLCTTWSETKWGSTESFPTEEMRIRGDHRRLWFGALVALPSGAAAALSFLSGNFGSLVGVAISASLLPPAVNTGLLFSYSLLAWTGSGIGHRSTLKINGTTIFKAQPRLTNCPPLIDNDYLPLYSCNMSEEACILAINSFLITMINILCIGFMAIIVLQIKNVLPLASEHDIAQLWHLDNEKMYKISSITGDKALDDDNLQDAVTDLKSTNDEPIVA